MSESMSLGAARSWLFTPGDNPGKVEKATRTAADIVLFDLEDAVAEDMKPAAREQVAAFISAHPDQRQRLWVRVNSLHTRHLLLDLAMIVPTCPGGVMVPKINNRQELEVIDHYLSALEVASGQSLGSIRLIIVATETPASLFATGSYGRAPRLVAMTWGAEDIATSLGASANRREDGSYDFTYQLARSLCLAGAAAAGVRAIETIHDNFRDEKGLLSIATEACRAGFSGMLAIHPAQVEPINSAFTPSATQVEVAKEIIELFAQHPDRGTIGYKGRMLDLPHLARAKAVYSRAGLR